MKKTLNLFPSFLDETTPNELYLMLRIAEHMDESRKAFPGKKRLMALTGWSEDRLDRTLKSLYKKEILLKERKDRSKGKFSGNEYKVLTRKIGVFVAITSDIEDPELTKGAIQDNEPDPCFTGMDNPSMDNKGTKYSDSLSILSSEVLEKEITKEKDREEELPDPYPGKKEAHEVIDFFEAYTKKQVRLRSDARLKAIISRMKEMKLTMSEVKMAIMWQAQSSDKHCTLETIFRPKNVWIFERALEGRQRTILEKRLAEWEENQSIPEEEKTIPRSQWTEEEKLFVMRKVEKFHTDLGTIGDHKAMANAVKEHGNPSILTISERNQLIKQ